MKNVRPRILVVNRAFVIDKDKILIIKRAKTDPYKPGEWEVPGGKLDDGQDVSEALEREVFEETNLAVIPLNRLAYYNTGKLIKGKYKGLAFIQLFGIVKKVGEGKVKLSKEHDDFSWVTTKGIQKYKLTEETVKALNHMESLIRERLRIED